MTHPIASRPIASRPVILITGASRGLGAAMAERLSQDSTVYRTSRSQRESSNSRDIRMDVTDEMSVRAAVDRVLKLEGRIDVLINNAGIVLTRPGETTSIAAVSRLMDVNFLGAMRVTQAVLPGMQSQRQGIILNISSMAAAIPLPYRASYAASKAALEAWAWGLRLETQPFGIRVSCIQAGDCQTELSEQEATEYWGCPISDQSEAASNARARYLDDEAQGMRPDVFAQRITQILRQPPQKLRFRYAVGPCRSG